MTPRESGFIAGFVLGTVVWGLIIIFWLGGRGGGMTAAAVPGSPDYVPAKIRAGGKPSVENCFGCPDEITKVTPRGTRIRACARSGRVVYKTLRCPKWPGVKA